MKTNARKGSKKTQSYSPKTPTEARSLLREYLRSKGAEISKVKGSTAKYANLSDVATWYKSNHGVDLNTRWMGRHLNSCDKVTKGSSTSGSTVYRTV